jgi:putative peptide zinc metalloprotease protein
MPRTNTPAFLIGLSRRMIAVLAAFLILVGGGIATYAATGGFSPAADETPPTGAAASASAEAVAATSPTPTPTSPEATPDAAAQAVTLNENAGGAGANNIVMLNNNKDERLTVKGSIQLNRINAPNVAPTNLARAYSSCVDCETLAVAMQINLIRRDTRRAVPQNAAVAINYECSGCRTIAVAFQYTLSVEDPMQTPKDVRDLVKQLDVELRDISRHPSTLADAIDRVNVVIERYAALAANLDERRDEATADTTPGAAAETPASSPSPSPSPMASPVDSPSALETASPSTPEPSTEPSLTPSASP